MKFHKHLSTVLSVALILCSGTLPTKVDASSNYYNRAQDLPAAASHPITLNQILSDWNNIMATEQAKLPQKDSKNRQCYWNHYGMPEGETYSVYTYTVRNCWHHHGEANTNTQHCIRYDPPDGIVDENYNKITETNYKECIGFSRLLAMDAFQTHVFVRYTLESQNNKKYLHYKSGRKEEYQPRIGDNVRISVPGLTDDHSIFITKVSGNDIYLAQCNADFQTCKIEWNVKMSKSELISRAKYVERVALFGDINIDGQINQTDVSLFANTVMKDGTFYNNNYRFYDVDQNGYIDEQDYYMLQNIAASGSVNNATIALQTCGTHRSRWRPLTHDILSNGCFYKKNQSGGVSLVGVLDATVTSLSVPSSVYSSADHCNYQVTEIGLPSTTYFASTYLGCLETIILPDTVKKIQRGAFAETGSSALKYLYFSGSNPQLETIETEAFYGVDKMTSLDLTSATKLNTIGNYAFGNCTNLRTIRFPGYTSGSIVRKIGRTAGILPTNSNKTVSLYFANTALALLRIEMQDSDITRWQNGSVRIYSSRSRFNDNSNDLLAQTLCYNTIRTYYKETYQYSE